MIPTSTCKPKKVKNQCKDKEKNTYDRKYTENPGEDVKYIKKRRV